MLNKAKNFIAEEFSRQVNNLLVLGYPELAKLTEEQFLRKLRPLKKKLLGIKFKILNLEKGYAPFVIVIKPELVPVEKAFALVKRQNKNGVIKLQPKKPKDFEPVNFVKIPKSSIYVLTNIYRGDKLRNIVPSLAEKNILKNDCAPLTLEEGVALITHFPDLLIKNHCFSLLASRTKTGKHVPAIWINAKKEPNLGWCWYGNPHSWLGSAFCEGRV